MSVFCAKNEKENDNEKQPKPQMKILVILPRFPYPLEKGDKLRAYHQIRTLAQNDEVYLFALSHHKVDKSSIDELRHYCRDICIARLSRLSGVFRVLRNFLSVRSLQIGYWDSRKARKQCRRFADKVNPDVVYAQMVRTIDYAAQLEKPKVMDFQDALSLNFERRMMTHRGLRYFLQHYEFKMLRSAEFRACSIFDRLTVISEIDRDAIPQHRDTVIDVVRNGVDADYYSPQAIQHSGDKPYDILFCGNMQYRPNIDAARFLVKEIMPKVWREYPSARVAIAGATPSASVRQLASDQVTVTGFVPDMRLLYAQSKVFVAPMRIGSGLQNKLLEAMSMHLPCITTSLANHSLRATDTENILVCDDAPSFAKAIVSLLRDEEARVRISDNAQQYVHSNFSWQATGLQLRQILQQAMEKHK